VPTRGQQQALDDLAALEAEGGPRVTSLPSAPGSEDVVVALDVDCRDAPNTPDGIRLRRRERLQVRIPANFPFQLPIVTTPHDRWAATPHVQWARQVCLYRSPAIEWNPADGIHGFMDRLLDWLLQASAGQLDPNGQPIHPPVAYQVTSSPSSITVVADAPRPAGEAWLGFALLRRRGPHRWDIDGWATPSDDWRATVSAPHGDGTQVIAAPVLLLPGQIGVEYPLTGAQLLNELRRQNTSSVGLFALMGQALRVNTILTGGAAPPLFTILGAPGLGIRGQELATHVVAWELTPDAGTVLTPMREVIAPTDDADAQAEGELLLDRAQGWLADVQLRWVRIHESRPEVTVRRDNDTPAALLRDRKILILGVGALGAPVAEACVRAGAAEVAIVDKGLVHPGILVRQAYTDDDIDEAKAAVTAARLGEIYPQTPVTFAPADAVSIVTDASQLEQFDLVIDATADRIVRHVIEDQRRAHGQNWPHLITMMIGPKAARGIVTVNPASSCSGAVDLLRRLSLHARQSPDLTDVVADFYPDHQGWDLFQPEPGCSDATFVGGYADVTGLAGQLLTAGLAELAGSKPSPAAIVVRMPGAGGRTDRITWPPDRVFEDPVGEVQVRLSRSAAGELHAEARRGARVRGRRVETGGMLFGSYDPAAGILWIDAASGPAPESVLSADYFRHGTKGTDELRASYRDSSARTIDFVGFWHTHPDGEAAPSATDWDGMTGLVDRVPGCRYALMMILGGSGSTWDGWLEHGSRSLPDVFVRLVRRGEKVTSPAGPGRTGDRVRHGPEGRFWSGGFGDVAARESAAPRWRRWSVLRWGRHR